VARVPQRPPSTCIALWRGRPCFRSRLFVLPHIFSSALKFEINLSKPISRLMKRSSCHGISFFRPPPEQFPMVTVPFSAKGAAPLLVTEAAFFLYYHMKGPPLSNAGQVLGDRRSVRLTLFPLKPRGSVFGFSPENLLPGADVDYTSSPLPTVFDH